MDADCMVLQPDGKIVVAEGRAFTPAKPPSRNSAPKSSSVGPPPAARALEVGHSLGYESRRHA